MVFEYHEPDLYRTRAVRKRGKINHLTEWRKGKDLKKDLLNSLDAIAEVEET